MPIQKQQAAPPKPQARVSLNPDNYSEGGLLDDAEVTIKEAAWVLWDYNGRISTKIPALGVSLEEADKSHDQYLSAGDSKYFVPSEDGEFLVPVGDKTQLNSNCNAAAFLASLVDAGFPREKLDEGGISILQGTECHVHRVAQPKRAGLAQPAAPGDREKTMLVVDRVNRLPWEAKGKATAAKPAIKPATAAGKAAAPVAAKGGKANGEAVEEAATATDAPTAADVDNQLQELIVGMLAEGPVEKKTLPAAVFKAVAKSDPARNQMLALVYDDGWIKQGPWKYSGGVLSLG